MAEVRISGDKLLKELSQNYLSFLKPRIMYA